MGVETTGNIYSEFTLLIMTLLTGVINTISYKLVNLVIMFIDNKL